MLVTTGTHQQQVPLIHNQIVQFPLKRNAIVVGVVILHRPAVVKTGNVASAKRRATLRKYVVPQQDTQDLQEEETTTGVQSESSLPTYSMYHNHSRLTTSLAPLYVDVGRLNSIPVTMELDTSAALSVINEDTFAQINQAVPTSLAQSEIVLQTCMGEKIPIRGIINVKVECKQFQGCLSLLVVAGSGPNLLGRD